MPIAYTYVFPMPRLFGSPTRSPTEDLTRELEEMLTPMLLVLTLRLGIKPIVLLLDV